MADNVENWPTAISRFMRNFSSPLTLSSISDSFSLPTAGQSFSASLALSLSFSFESTKADQSPERVSMSLSSTTVVEALYLANRWFCLLLTMIFTKREIPRSDSGEIHY